MTDEFPTKKDLESMLEDEYQKVSHRDNCLRVAMSALKAIAQFGHVGGPACVPMAPVYECGCFDKSQRDLATEAIERINKLDSADVDRHNAEIEAERKKS